MEHQLVLIDEKPKDWRLDEDIRQAGRTGLAAARAALVEAARRAPHPGTSAA
ncbi:MAG TPA: hypothetical protein VFA11_19585 [Acidimicrobiales bacterium]|nr:hypothetical protein [Acidimicrobiales bacterium]